MISGVSFLAKREAAHSTCTPAFAIACGIGRSCRVVAGCMYTASVFEGLPFGTKRMPSRLTMPCVPAKP